jgi:hypothetical protein
MSVGTSATLGMIRVMGYGEQGLGDVGEEMVNRLAGDLVMYERKW